MLRFRRHAGWSAAACILISFFSALSLQASGIFLPVFAGNIGASKLQIGIIAGVQGAAYLVSSLFSGRQSDIRGRLPFIRLGLGLATLAYAGHVFATTPAMLVVVRTVLGFSIAMSDAALMAYNFEISGRTGRFASLAALGWLAGAVVGIFYHNYVGLFVVSAIGCTVAFLVSWTLAKEGNRRPLHPALGKTIVRNFRVYVPFLLRNVGGNMVWFILPLFLVGLGASLSWVAILQCVNTGAQFLIMMWVDRVKASKLFMVGMVSSGAVFVIYALARNYLQIIPAQIVLAASWSCLYIGSLMILLRDNEERATSAGVLFSTGSLSQAVGPFLGGFVAQFWGYQPLLYVACAFCLAGAGFAAAPMALANRRERATVATRK